LRRWLVAFAITAAAAGDAQLASSEPSGEPQAGLTQHGPLLDLNAPDGIHVDLAVEYPQDGAALSEPVCGTLIAGRALALHGRLPRFDVAIVLDTSRSTTDPSGSDINGNGVIGQQNTEMKRSIFAAANTDPGDSILAAEVAAAREIVRGLDPRSTRVTLIAFAGEPPGAGGDAFGRTPQPPAVTLEPLTSELGRIDAALDELLAADPLGSTHMAAGVDQATAELTGLSGGHSIPHPDRDKVVFFFTDGQPTLPHGPGSEADNVRSVLLAADRAHRAGIRIHSFAIGADALEGPLAVVELARRTNGYFTPIRRPGDLVHAVKEISVADISELRVRNRTTGEAARHLLRKSDGAWAGLVQLHLGENEIAVTARASEGSEATEVIRIHFAPEAPDSVIPQRFVERRNRLFEDCLSQLKEVSIRLERERNEKIRGELQLEIERERKRARQRAATQRKRLEISLIEEGEPAP
jgi:hypothetical protein